MINKFRNLFIFTLITLVIWMGYELYQINESTPPNIKKELTNPIQTEIQTEILEKLPARFE